MQIQFGAFEFDDDRLVLRLRGSGEVDLRRQCAALLACLARRIGSVVSKEEITAELWGDIAVEPNSLNYVIWDLRRTLAAAGHDGLVETVGRRGYRLRADQETSNASSRDALGDRPKLLGRQTEIERLKAAWASVNRGERATAVVAGEAGIGKSFLVDCFLRDLAASDDTPAVARIRCSQRVGTTDPYGAILELIEEIATSPEIVPVIRDVAPTWLVQLRGAISDDEILSLRRALGGTGGSRMVREALRLFDQLAQERPLVLVIEDIHWADPGSLAVIEALTARFSPARLLTVVTLRTHDLSEPQAAAREMLDRITWRSGSVVRIDLNPLSTDAASQLAAAALGERDENGLSAATVVEISGGNPLFLVALSTYVRQVNEAIVNDGRGAPQPPREVIASQLPGSIRQTIADQLRLLPERDVEIIEAASVAGVEFTEAELIAALSENPQGVDADAARLARNGQFFVALGEALWPDGTTTTAYRFRHGLYHRVVYADVAPEKRRMLHGRIGDRLAAGHARHISPVVARVIEHYEAAGDVERLLMHQEQATAIYMGRYAMGDARMLCESVLRTLERVPPSPEISRRFAARWLDHGNLLLIGPNSADVSCVASYERAYALAHEVRDSELIVRAQLGRCVALRISGRIRDARAVAADLVDLCNRDVPNFLAAAHLYRAWTEVPCDIRSADRDLEKTLSLWNAGGQRSPLFIDIEATTFAMRAFLGTIFGKQQKSRAWIDQAWTCARAIGAPAVIADVGGASCITAVIAGDPSAAARYASIAKPITDENSLEFTGELIDLSLAWAAIGEDRRGLDTFSSAVAARARNAIKLYQSIFEVELARALIAHGEYERAAEWCDAAAHHEETFLEAEILRTRAELVLAQRKDRQRARTLLDRAAEIAEAGGERLFYERAKRARERLA